MSLTPNISIEIQETQCHLDDSQTRNYGLDPSNILNLLILDDDVGAKKPKNVDNDTHQQAEIE